MRLTFIRTEEFKNCQPVKKKKKKRKTAWKTIVNEVQNVELLRSCFTAVMSSCVAVMSQSLVLCEQ